MIRLHPPVASRFTYCNHKFLCLSITASNRSFGGSYLSTFYRQLIVVQRNSSNTAIHDIKFRSCHIIRLDSVQIHRFCGVKCYVHVRYTHWLGTKITAINIGQHSLCID